MDVAKVVELIEIQVQHCEKQLELHQNDEILAKSLASAKKALSILSSPAVEASRDGPTGLPSVSAQVRERDALDCFMQSVLDSTYYEENQLVDEKFPPSTSRGKIGSIIKSLALPTALCENAQSLLDNQLLECLHWRVGALLYMYCHTLMSDDQRKKEAEPRQFLECCCAGVGHLRLMLSARTPLGAEEDYIAHDPSVPELLQKGIFSDVHMLALMYAGELCYWSWEVARDSPSRRGSSPDPGRHDKGVANVKETGKIEPYCATTMKASNGSSPGKGATSEHSSPSATAMATSDSSTAGQSLYSVMQQLQGETFVHRWRSDFSAVALGREFLSKYVDAARGPLKSQGWNYDRAVQLLVKLKKAAA